MAFINGKEILFAAQIGQTDSPIPIEVATESEMTVLLEKATIGSVYKYTGESTDTYENGALYIVEAVTE